LAIVVTAPTLNEEIPKITPAYRIAWTDSGAGDPFAIHLYKNDAFVSDLGDTSDNYLDWTPSVDLESGSDYTIKVINFASDDGDSNVFTLYSLKFSVYHVDFDAWTQFNSIDELQISLLTGGSLAENINLILTNSGAVNKYPGDSTTTFDAIFKTRRYDMQMGILRRLWLDFTGASTTVQTRVYNDAYGTPYYKDKSIGTFLRKVWRGVAGGYNRGDSFELHITNADIIKNAVVDVSIIGKGVR